jgi:hypothetical protein
MLWKFILVIFRRSFFRVYSNKTILFLHKIKTFIYSFIYTTNIKQSHTSWMCWFYLLTKNFILKSARKGLIFTLSHIYLPHASTKQYNTNTQFMHSWREIQEAIAIKIIHFCQQWTKPSNQPTSRMYSFFACYTQIDVSCCRWVVWERTVKRREECKNTAQEEECF